MPERLRAQILAAHEKWLNANRRSSVLIRMMILEECAIQDCLRQARSMMGAADFVKWVHSLALPYGTPGAIKKVRLNGSGGPPMMPFLTKSFDRS
jgi:hypothetical protein